MMADDPKKTSLDRRMITIISMIISTEKNSPATGAR